MPFDAMFLTAVAAELRPALVGARVDKIQQPARDTVVLQLRGRDGGGRLLLSANGNRPRVHLTQAQLENPAQPPMFCMLLRKHLAGGRLAGIRQPAAERMLDLTFDCTDELGVPCRKHLILELVGRNSNLILTGPDGRILDCLRRVDFEMSELRQLLPGLFYHEPPRQDRRIPQETTEAGLLALLARPDAAMRLDKWLLAHFAGLSPLIARELSFRFAGETDAPIPTLDAARLAAFLTAEFAALPPVQMQPMLLWKDGAPTDFTYRDIRQYGGYLRAEPCESFSALLDRFYTETDHAERMRQRSQTLRKAISNLHERTRRKPRTTASSCAVRATSSRRTCTPSRAGRRCCAPRIFMTRICAKLKFRSSRTSPRSRTPRGSTRTTPAPSMPSRCSRSRSRRARSRRPIWAACSRSWPAPRMSVI